MITDERTAKEHKESFIEWLAHNIIIEEEPDIDDEPPAFRSVYEIAKARDEMERCTFDSDEEMWDKARQIAETIYNKYNPNF